MVIGIDGRRSNGQASAATEARSIEWLQNSTDLAGYSWGRSAAYAGWAHMSDLKHYDGI